LRPASARPASARRRARARTTAPRRRSGERRCVVLASSPRDLRQRYFGSSELFCEGGLGAGAGGLGAADGAGRGPGPGDVGAGFGATGGERCTPGWAEGAELALGAVATAVGSALAGVTTGRSAESTSGGGVSAGLTRVTSTFGFGFRSTKKNSAPDAP